MIPRTLTPALTAALLDALALVLPTECASCGAPDRPVCVACASLLAPDVTRLAATRAHAPPLFVTSAMPYGGPVRGVLSKLKESGRTDVVPALAPALAAAVADAYRRVCTNDVVLVVVPSSRAAFRTRGYNPAELLVRRARTGLPSIRPLRVAQPTRDQAGLTMRDRQSNLAGSMAVRTRFSEGSLRGTSLLLVDDVITTGATLLECRRALETAGARVLGAATLAFAERRTGRSSVVRLSQFAPE
ncbi:ComF family protein [Subtercola sp. YIM 133946]|uniref:ComF family protein n=1 Tax=Subtercola sp. YIM 133946 TaxID=3118909 RepID=UPI002F9337F8